MTEHQHKEDENGIGPVNRRDFLRRAGRYSVIAAAVLAGYLPDSRSGQERSDGKALGPGAPAGNGRDPGSARILRVGDTLALDLDSCQPVAYYRLQVPDGVETLRLSILSAEGSAVCTLLDSRLGAIGAPHAVGGQHVIPVPVSAGVRVLKFQSEGPRCLLSGALEATGLDAWANAYGDAAPASADPYADCAWDNWTNNWGNSWGNSWVQYDLWANWMQSYG